jgi:hypothetical protein
MTSSQPLLRFLLSSANWAARLFALVVLGLFLCSPSAFAQDEAAVTVTVPDTSAAPGDTVAVPVRIGNLSQAGDVTSYGLELTFDSTVTSYAGFEDGNTLSGAAGFTVNDNPEIPRIGAFGSTPINDVGSEGVLLRILMTVDSEDSTTVTLTNLEFNTGSPPADPAEPKFTLTGTTNSAPQVGTPLPNDTLKIPGPSLKLVNLGPSVFTDPNGDSLSISASSSNSAVVSIGPGADPVVLQPSATGQARITITGTDPFGATATETFLVVVENRPEDEDVPTELVSAAVESSGSGTTEVSFGDTGVGATFQDVQDAGTVEVSFIPDSNATGDPDFDESFANVSGFRWDIENEGTTFTSVDASFALDDPDVVGIGDSSTVTLLVASGPDETFESVSTRLGGSNSDVLVAEGLTGFSTFKMASNDSSNPLPVELAAFTATTTESGGLLKWRTASETNNAGFEVQHKGPSASGFANVGFVEGAGTSTTAQRYQYRLSGLKPGTHRFRLQQRDTDGTTSLSDPVTLRIEAERALTLRATGPNPVRQKTQLAFTVKQNGPAEVSLYNVLGQQVRQLYSQTATAGERYTVEVDATGLPTGKYFAQLSGPSGTRTQQIVVVR